MSQISPNLAMKYLAGGQQDGHLIHNEALNVLDALCQASVKTRTLNSAPAGASGDRYIVASGVPGGDPWTGLAGQIVGFYGGAWVPFVPKDGWRVWLEDEKLWVQWVVGAGWRSVTGDGLIGMYRSTTQTISAASTWTPVDWNVENHKDAAVYTHSTSTNPSQITFLEAGKYLVSAEVTIGQTAAGSSFNDLKLTINTADVAGSLARHATIANTDRSTQSVQMIIVVAVNDVLRVEAQHSASTCEISANGSRLTIRKLTA